MTTATHTQGLQAMYSPVQQVPFGYGQPQMTPWAQGGIEQHLAFELFRLGQLVQATGHLVGPQAGKPSREQIAHELFRLGQVLQQAGMSTGIGQGWQYGQGQYGQGQFGQGQYGQGQYSPISQFGPQGQYGQGQYGPISQFGQFGPQGQYGQNAPYGQFAHHGQPGQFGPQPGQYGQFQTPIWS